jgi:hypothetical protein
MGLLTRALKPLRRAPGVPEARHLAERAVAPYLRADLHQLHATLLEAVGRLEALEAANHQVTHAQRLSADAIVRIEANQPAVLSAIASTNGTSRLVRRELDAVRGELDEVRKVAGGDAEGQTNLQSLQRELEELRQSLSATDLRVDAAATQVRSDLAPHIETLGWLLRRVETVRAEMMHELRYGRGTTEPLEVEIVNPEALRPSDGAIRLNLGCGHLPIEGYANVDMRRMPGVDIIAPADALPLEPGTVAEIFSAHMLEHFADEELRRRMLPYWFSLLQPDGRFGAVVPDIEAMLRAYVDGQISFETLRHVTYGEQEYEGDFHFNGFTASSISEVLAQAGFDRIEIIATGRRNGDAFELEVAARRPAD